ncbi:transposase [Streptomyces javensis]|uniref:Transposase n=1 Tax=Streptomyces javensis TaxID=114698 RepID=A0ABS0REH5_9ACTN|nr:transposase [Streptomyces javensis]
MVIRRGELTNTEWVRLRPHLPKSGQRGGRWARHRKLINGVSYRLRTGMPRQVLPARPWKTVYERHRRWRRTARGTRSSRLSWLMPSEGSRGRCPEGVGGLPPAAG